MGKSDILGRTGELQAIAYFKQHGYKVLDKTKSKKYQDIDTDLIIEKDGERTLIEVKFDTRIRETGNIFAEQITNVREQKQGWLYKSKADYIMYIAAFTDYFYIFKTEKLREYVKNHPELRTSYAYDRTTSKGKLVSVERFQKEFDVKKVYFNYFQ